jgi:hypothetical protein
MRVLTWMSGLLFLGLAAASPLAGCGDSEGDGGTGNTGNAASGACAPASGCPEVASECLSLVDNSGADVFALRIAQLTVTKPDKFTDSFVRSIVYDGVTLNLPACTTQQGNPLLSGMGSFSWVLEFDKTAGTLRTGGAKPVADPYEGYCFVNEPIQGFEVMPFEVAGTIDGNVFAMDTAEDVVVPIYTDATATEAVLMPLRDVRLSNVQISSDNNCIGDLNDENLDPNNLCLYEPSNGILTFNDDAKLEGYITLADADSVIVPQLGSSLCVLLAGSTFDDGDGHCTKDAAGAFVYEGDWCDATAAAADATCHDAVRLEATFAAAGVKLNGICP